MLVAADLRYKKALAEFRQQQESRQAKVESLKAEYEKKKSGFLMKKRQSDEEVDEFERKYATGEPSAIVDYTSMVLERSEYPEGFPQEFRVAHAEDSKQLVIDYELPTSKIVRMVQEFSYVKSKDQISERRARNPT